MIIRKIKLNKKTFSLAFLLVILAVVSFVNYKYFVPENKEASSIDEQVPLNAEFVSNMNEEAIMSGSTVLNNAFFTEYKTLREQTRSENISILEDIVKSGKDDSQSVENAQNAMVELVKMSELELSVENQIKAKGFSDCIVFIHDDYANIVINCKDLTAQQAAQIQDIVNRNCNIEISKISIATSQTK